MLQDVLQSLHYGKEAAAFFFCSPQPVDMHYCLSLFVAINSEMAHGA
jgi:hypothetical protein